MPTIEAIATIIVKPRPPDGWIMVTPRLNSEIYFHGRQRALQFARAYANLHRPVMLRVLGETGDVEAEELFPDTLRDDSHAMPQAKVVRLVADRSQRAAD
jgi:hypothetical protein